MNLDELLQEQHTTAAPYAVVQGTVTDESGKPAQGIPVLIEARESKGKYKAVTDKNGKYTYSGLQGGEYLMAVEYKGAIGLSVSVALRIGRVAVTDFDLRSFTSDAKAADFDSLKRLLSERVESVEVSLTYMTVPSEFRKKYEKAMDAVSRKDYETAVAILKELVGKVPGEVLFWRQLGEIQFDLARYADAATAFRKGIELRPDVADYPGLLSMSLLFTGELEEARQQAEKAAALNKVAGAQAFYNLGLRLTDLGDPVKAEGAFTRATELDESHSDAFLQLGITLLSTHSDIRDARKPLQRFLQLAPGSENRAMAEELIAAIDKGPSSK
jgi:tetratricopeptide (TPR) repeat protein